MLKEELGMIMWAQEHPYLYTVIKLKPVLVVAFMSLAIRATFSIFKGAK